jgi:ElaB/YqjD/DUF883 family membrane-anchored ribosome-binding protein
MSKRGSSNAIRFAGKIWKLNNSASSSVKLNEKEEKVRKRADKKAKKIKKQFEVLLKNFKDDKSLKIEDLFNQFEREFSNTTRSHSVRHYETFKTKNDNSIMSLQEYFTTKPWKSIETKSNSYFRSKFISTSENPSPKVSKN